MMRLLLVVTVLFAIAGSIAWLHDNNAPVPAIQLAFDEIDVGTVDLHVETPLSWVFANQASEPLRVVGLDGEIC